MNNEARDRFLDWLYEDLAEALRRLLPIADGDYSADKYAEHGCRSDFLSWPISEINDALRATFSRRI